MSGETEEGWVGERMRLLMPSGQSPALSPQASPSHPEALRAWRSRGLLLTQPSDKTFLILPLLPHLNLPLGLW